MDSKDHDMDEEDEEEEEEEMGSEDEAEEVSSPSYLKEVTMTRHSVYHLLLFICLDARY